MHSTTSGATSPQRRMNGGTDGLDSLAESYPIHDSATMIAMSPLKPVSTRRPQTGVLSPLVHTLSVFNELLHERNEYYFATQGVKMSRRSREGPASDSSLAELARRGLTYDFIYSVYVIAV